MRYLLDTNVLRDARRQAHAPLNAWLAAQPRADLAISVVALLELERGVLRLERRDQVAGTHLRAWLTTDVPAAFAGAILPVDERVARRAARFHVPDRIPETDALVAATAQVHDLTLVTATSRTSGARASTYSTPGGCDPHSPGRTRLQVVVLPDSWTGIEHARHFGATGRA